MHLPREKVRETLAENAGTLRELHKAIHTNFAVRHESKKNWQAWKHACAKFHASYDALAFPGGLERAFELLEASDLAVAEIAVLYCEIRPYYFRSGYHRTKFVRMLRRVTLPRQLAIRIDRVWEEIHNRKLARRRGEALPSLRRLGP